RQVRKNAPLFRHVAEPAADDRVGRLSGYVRTLEHDAAGALLDQADDGTKGRRLTGTISPEQRDHFAVADVERDVEQDVRGAIMTVEPPDRELHAPGPSRCRIS